MEQFFLFSLITGQNLPSFCSLESVRLDEHAIYEIKIDNA